MTRDEVVSLVQQGLGFRSDLTTEIITQLRYQQEEVLEKQATLPWFLLTEFANINTVVGEERIPVPSDFLQEYEEGSLWFVDPALAEEDQWKPLAKGLLEDIKTAETGPPKCYALTKDYFRVFPVSDEAYQLQQIYYARAAELTTNIENVWLEHAADWLMNLVGTHMAEDLSNQDATLTFQQRMLVGQKRVMDETEARKHANQRYIMGGAD